MTVKTEAVILFGASGFIGRNLVNALVSDHIPTYGVTGSGSPIEGCAQVVSLKNLEMLPTLPRETVIINVAAFRYDAQKFAKDQQLAFEINNTITNRLYAFAETRKINEVRFASSSAIYPADWDLLDDERPGALNSPPHLGEFLYAWSKRWGELAADHYRSKSGISTTSFRLSNPYGPYDTTDLDAAHVATAFAIRALNDDLTFKIRGNSEARRDFVFSGDVANIFVRSLSLRDVHEALNLSSGQTVSIYDLAKETLKAAGISKPIETADIKSGAGVAVRELTSSRLSKLLPYNFSSLDEGLRHTIEWYKNATKQ